MIKNQSCFAFIYLAIQTKRVNNLYGFWHYVLLPWISRVKPVNKNLMCIPNSGKIITPFVDWNNWWKSLVISSCKLIQHVIEVLKVFQPTNERTWLFTIQYHLFLWSFFASMLGWFYDVPFMFIRINSLPFMNQKIFYFILGILLRFLWTILSLI